MQVSGSDTVTVDIGAHIRGLGRLVWPAMAFFGVAGLAGAVTGTTDGTTAGRVVSGLIGVVFLAVARVAWRSSRRARRDQRLVFDAHGVRFLAAPRPGPDGSPRPGAVDPSFAVPWSELVAVQVVDPGRRARPATAYLDLWPADPDFLSRHPTMRRLESEREGRVLYRFPTANGLGAALAAAVERTAGTRAQDTVRHTPPTLRTPRAGHA